ncbi:hypothetical protein ACH5RR_018527, partial [Cinchona calisaya]
LVESRVVYPPSHEPKIVLDKARFWHQFVREEDTEGNDTLVREFIATTHNLTGIGVQVRRRPVNFIREIINDYYQVLNILDSELTILRRSNIDYDLLLRELCDPIVPEGMAT